MSRNIFLCVIFISLTKIVSAQFDSLYGNVKSIKSEVEFLEKVKIKTRELISYSDYGEFGVIDSKKQIERATKYWVNSEFAPFYIHNRIYDQSGNAIKDIWFDREGNIEDEFEYKYDKNGNKTQYKKIYAKDDYYARNYVFNQYNLITSSIHYAHPDTNIYSYTRYIYNENNRLIETQSFRENGRLSKYYYAYKNNLKVKEIANYMRKWAIHKDGSKSQKIDSIGINYTKREYKYDNKRNLIEELKYQEGTNESVFIIKKTWKYDSFNRIVKENYYRLRSLEKINAVHTFAYNDLNLIKRKKIESLRMSSKNKEWRYEYNDQNLIKKLQITENSVVTIVEFKYKYDKHNNWIKQEKIVNGKKKFIWKRKIEYY